MNHDSFSLRSAPPGEQEREEYWEIGRIAKRAIRFSALSARHSALLAGSRACEAARLHTRQIESFQSEGGQGG
jgi:hypothetical protein